MLWDENWVPFLRRTKGICTMPFCLDLCCDTDFFLAEGHPTRERERESLIVCQKSYLEVLKN
jgi:hypothetical protein